MDLQKSDGLNQTDSFSAGPVCLRFSAEACAILQALQWSRQHQQVSHFSSLLPSDSRHPNFSSFFPFTSVSLAKTVSTLLLYQATMGSRTLVSRSTRLMSWPDWERYFRPPQSLVVFLLFISRIGGVGSHLHSLTHKFPQFPPKNLCFLVTLAVFSLVFATTDTAYY